uniref:Reverse transcriptase domain-containing protein n=1 Tax=Angiostrongylus cantonensis TaxID=6313 RepID=A0A0K0D2J1_ANGCA
LKRGKITRDTPKHTYMRGKSKEEVLNAQEEPITIAELNSRGLKVSDDHIIYCIPDKLPKKTSRNTMWGIQTKTPSYESVSMCTMVTESKVESGAFGIPFTLNGTNISECSGYIYLGPKVNILNDLAQELSRRKQAAWGAFKRIEDAVKRTKNTRLRAHLFDSTVLPYASGIWSLRKQNEGLLSVIERAVDSTMLGISRFTQAREGIRSSDLRERSNIKDAVLYAKQSKIRWAGHVMRMNDN